ncbi:MAG TPA: hypothetical protein VE111_01820 [Bradyrhizobium sp.]|nr:hypothetical protein [Bradyrhizobium sp.]
MTNYRKALLQFRSLRSDRAGPELRRPNVSLVQICCTSAVKAKLAADDSAATAAATASTKPAWRIVRVRRGYAWLPLVRRIGVLLMAVSASTARTGL